MSSVTTFLRTHHKVRGRLRFWLFASFMLLALGYYKVPVADLKAIIEVAWMAWTPFFLVGVLVVIHCEPQARSPHR